MRQTKCRGSGPRRNDRVDLLGGLLYCVCGRRIRSDGWAADRRYRKLHTKPCERWGHKARIPAEAWEEPILAQLGGIELDDNVIARVVAALGSTVRPVAIDRSRIERQMRELAMDHVGGGISDETYLARLKHLRESLAEIEETAQVGVSADRAVEWLRALAETWQNVDVPEARSDLLHSIYERIVVAGREFVSARLTPAAYAHGLALALPEIVAKARPTGVRRPVPGTTNRVPIE
jgi:truncated hemoglobin YjbI